MRKLNKISAVFLLALVTLKAEAQNVEMADTLRSEGKIYVVVAIILVILGGLIGFVALMDRKVSRLEKRIEKKD